MKYATALVCLRRMAALFGVDDKFTLRIPREVVPTWDAQLGWRKEDRTALGRWAPNSEMPNWYGHGVCNTEPRLRNEILTKYLEGWKPSASFDLPKKKQTQQQEGDFSPIDSTSAVTSSAEEVNIDDLDGSGSTLSGRTPSV